MSGSDLDAGAAREELYAVMKRDLGFEEKAERALELGERYLDVDNGHVARVDPQTDYWKAVASTDPDDGEFPVGLALDYETTYCRRTVHSEGPIALQDAEAAGWGDDPAYEAHGLECYHGTTIVVDDDTYGTVCFVSESARAEPFSEEETMFAELVARLLEHELERERTSERVDRLESFASVVSHDLRNPLNVATGYVESEREVRDSDRLAEASAALDRMSALIDDVLAMARQGRAVDATDRVRLSTLAEACWRNVDTPDAGLDVVDDVAFTADHDRVQQLFENLYRNAVEHGCRSERTTAGIAGEHDEPDVRVRVGALDDRDGFFVADDGPGIDEDAREAVFDAGYSTGGDGIGIGLAIVEGIVGAHDWTIEVTASERGGARFEVTDVVERP